MHTRYQITVDGVVRATFEADLTQASAPIRLDGGSTPFQTADARHDCDEAAALLIRWWQVSAMQPDEGIVADDEEYTVEEVIDG